MCPLRPLWWISFPHEHTSTRVPSLQMSPQKTRFVCGKLQGEMRSQPTSTTQSPANRYFLTSLLPYFALLKLRRPRRLHLRRRRPIRPRPRLMPHAPHRRRKPSARWHRIPSRLRVPDILPFAQKIQHERNRREQQQQIYERTRREVHCVVKNPGQQQDHSYDDEHGASNHPRYRRRTIRSSQIILKVGGFRLSPVQKKFSVVPRFCSDRCIGWE
jgi:hypothetical protein